MNENNTTKKFMNIFLLFFSFLSYTINNSDEVH